MNFEAHSSSATNGFVILNRGTLIIKDTSSTVTEKITGSNNSGFGVGIRCRDTLLLESGEISGNTAPYAVGTYFVKVDISGTDTYLAVKDLGNESWSFTISEKSPEQQEEDQPQSGTNHPLLLWIFLFLVAGSVLIPLVCGKKHRTASRQ